MPAVKELHVNGAKRPIDADAERTLLSVLRDDLDLTGCKYGCGEGRCGACTVLLDGQPTRSCKTSVADALLSLGVGRRTFFKVVGGGLVVACLAGSEAAAQRRPFGQRFPRELGA